MKVHEKNEILQKAAFWSDEKLKSEYYDSVHNCLGSQAERMEELGYEASDIRERRKIEDYLCDVSDLLEEICVRRGIELWQEDEDADSCYEPEEEET